VVRDPEALLGVLQSRRISLFEPVPSLLQALLDIQEDRPLPLPSLRWVLPTGEALPPACARAWFKAYPDIPLMNAYGPAECADDVAFHALYQAPSVGEPVPIGAPTANAELYILNSECNILPIGTVGEIAVGGVGVGRGYLGDPRRTAAVFVPNPAGPPGSRLYLTGDLGRWRANGTIEFVGRNDFQIKLRGFRIEPGEIEALVENHDRVKRALVTVRRLGGSDQLVAYWEPGVSGDEALEPQLSADLAERLPAYMVPGIWVKIDHWPLNANGKIDQSALPVPQVAQGQVIAAETETERRLIAFWQDILPEATLGRDSDFFASGGHSLLATRLIARLRRDGYAELPLRTIFDASTIRTLAERLDRIGLAGGQDQPALVPVERGPAMPLSLAQQRLWLVERLSGSGTASYNMSATLRLRGVLDVEALQRGLDALLERHEVLRTGYPEIDGEPVAVVNPDASVEMTVEDLSALSGNAREERIREADQASARTVFDIAEAPLLRARLLRLDDREHLLLFAMHHLVADGWSVGVMIDELAAVYRASLQGHSSDLAAADLPALPVQYADYAVWQRNLLTADRVKSETDYWRKQLSGVPPLLNLPVDHPRPAVASHSGDVVHFEVSAKLLRAAELLAQAHGATAFMVLLAAFQLHLHRLANSPDVVVGTDTAGRGRSELEGLIGFFVNVVPLRSRCEPGADFISLLTRTRQTTLDAFEHEALPFDRIVEAVGLPRDRRFNPLVQALFVLQNVPSGRFDLPGLDVEILPARERYSKFDTALFLEPRGETLAAEWVFATALFDQASVQRFAKDWLALLEQVLESPQTPLDNFALPIRQEEVQMDHTRRMSAKLDRLKKITRPAEGALRTQPSSPVVLRNPVRTSFLTPDSIFPVVVEPAAPDLDPAAWAGEQRPFIETTLCRHAAILFRNFGIATPQEFEAFAEAIEPGLFGGYGDLPKQDGGKNIYRSTPYPERQMILYHNESSHLERWPRKQWFFCEQAAPVGGATPIVDCREMLRRLPAELVDEFERKQLTYIRTFTKRLDVGWRDFFKTDDKAEVEARCRAGGIDCRWLDEETLQTRTRCPAVIRHPITSERSFFNQVQLHHTACLDAGVRDDLLEMVGIERLPRQVVFGDGTPIPDDIIEIVGEAYEACAVRFDWQPGDVVMLDNMLAAHARDPFEGPRKIVVAMGDMVERAQIIPAGENTPAGQASTLEPILQE
jgi:non-ribosomal peptide synthetase component F/alpha-ketoglutarate-dependent taurine dioxygenase